MAEHVFTPEDIPAMVRELIDYCKKWGLWRDTSVCAGGKRYLYYTPRLGPEYYGSGGLLEGYDDVWVGELSVEGRERLFSAPIYRRDTGGYEFVCLCNPEQLLDMTFEGPLYDLLHQTRYRTELAEMSPEGQEEIEKLLLDRSSNVRCEVAALGLDVREEAMSDAESLIELLDYYGDIVTVTDYGELEARVYEGFSDIFQRYGLDYDLSTGTTLTAHRI